MAEPQNAYGFIMLFAEEHWFLSFCAIFAVYQLLLAPFRIVRRWIQHRNIKSQGWPPPHLDADGDLHLPEKDNGR
jgi:hypothetical protein